MNNASCGYYTSAIAQMIMTWKLQERNHINRSLHVCHNRGSTRISVVVTIHPFIHLF